jgi:hypothetical protein
MQRLTNPLPLFLDRGGALLDAGYVYVGEPNQDPEANPIGVYLDQDLSIPIPQPLRTLGGVIVSGANAAFVYMAENDYSLTVRDANQQLVSYIPSVAVAQTAYQPQDADLTAIAQQGTTAYGRSLLSLANQAALKAAVGSAEALPLTGGTVSGDILRQGAGDYTYWADSGMSSGREFLAPASGPDPTSQPGDKWFKY